MCNCVLAVAVVQLQTIMEPPQNQQQQHQRNVHGAICIPVYSHHEMTD